MAGSTLLRTIRCDDPRWKHFEVSPRTPGGQSKPRVERLVCGLPAPVAGSSKRYFCRPDQESGHITKLIRPLIDEVHLAKRDVTIRGPFKPSNFPCTQTLLSCQPHIAQCPTTREIAWADRGVIEHLKGNGWLGTPQNTIHS